MLLVYVPLRFAWLLATDVGVRHDTCKDDPILRAPVTLESVS
jgi:hypothetical protein